MYAIREKCRRRSARGAADRDVMIAKRPGRLLISRPGGTNTYSGDDDDNDDDDDDISGSVIAILEAQWQGFAPPANSLNYDSSHKKQSGGYLQTDLHIVKRAAGELGSEWGRL